MNERLRPAVEARTRDPQGCFPARDLVLFVLLGMLLGLLAVIALDMEWTQTLALLKAADIQVSATGNLLPQWGQRERIARLFGFVYRMDVDDPAIRKIAALVSRP